MLRVGEICRGGGRENPVFLWGEKNYETGKMSGNEKRDAGKPDFSL